MTQPIYEINGTGYIYLFGELHGFESQQALSDVCGIANISKYPGDNPKFGFNIGEGSGMIINADGVFLITNGSKYHVGNNETLAYYQLNGAQQPVTTAGGQMCLDMLPAGEQILIPATAEAAK